MSRFDYTAATRRELVGLIRSNRLFCCQQSFLVGLLQGSRLTPFVRARKNLRRRLANCLQALLPESQKVVCRGSKIWLPGLDQLFLREKFVDRMRIVSGASRVNHCHVAFLQGLFVAHGYIQSPNRGYHLEFRLHGSWLAAAFRKVAAGLRLKFCFYQHEQYKSFYLKSGRRIARLLNILGLFDRGLEFTDLLATRNLLSQVNRQVNSETANINRLINAAESSISHIRELLAWEDQEIWTESLHQMAQMRLKYPHDSIESLGKRFEPPLTKSAVNHRLRRIKALHAKVFAQPVDRSQPS